MKGNAGAFLADIAWVIMDKVSTDSDSGAIWFLFFWSDCAYNAGIGDCPACGYFMFMDEEYGIGAFDAVAYTLC